MQYRLRILCRHSVHSLHGYLQVLADATGELYIDSCDFSRSLATYMVKMGEGVPSSKAIVRNAILSTANYEAIK